MPESTLREIIDAAEVAPEAVIADCLTSLMRQDRFPQKNLLRRIAATGSELDPKSEVLGRFIGDWYLTQQYRLDAAVAVDRPWVEKLSELRVAWSNDQDKAAAESAVLINHVKHLYMPLLSTIQQVEYKELMVFRNAVAQMRLPTQKIIGGMFYGQLSEVVEALDPTSIISQDNLMLFVPARLWSDLFLDDLLKTNYLPPSQLSESLSYGHVGRLRLPNNTEVELFSDSVLLSATKLTSAESPQEVLLINPQVSSLVQAPRSSLVFTWIEDDVMRLHEAFQLVVPTQNSIHRFIV